MELTMDESVDLLLNDEVHRIVGCAIEVANILGHGLIEKTYENASSSNVDCKASAFRSSRISMSCISE